MTWEPATPREVAALFAGTGPWWIAGGYAVEFAVGRPYRDHADIDILLLRRDQLVVQDVLAGWEWWAADPPGTPRPWTAGERLPDGVHDIWCRPAADRPWRVQVMLDESDGPRLGLPPQPEHPPTDRVHRRGHGGRNPLPDTGNPAVLQGTATTRPGRGGLRGSTAGPDPAPTNLAHQRDPRNPRQPPVATGSAPT